MASPDEERKISALLALAENFGKEFPENLLDMWLELLKPYSAQHAHLAVRVVLEQYEYKTMPPFAVLRRALDDLVGISEKALVLQAVAEWGVLIETIDRIGYYGVPKLHPTTAYVVRLMGGWDSVCRWPEKGMEFRRKEFIELWAQSHGKADRMKLGADAMRFALGGAHHPGAQSIGVGLGEGVRALIKGQPEQ